MKLVRMTIENFRGYKEPTSIEFDDLTVLIGKNDVGKSTVLEALDVFFYDGKGTIKLDSGDINVTSCNEGAKDIKISAVFGDLPDKVIIDAENETTLRDEYLLNRDGHLEIIKTFKGGATTASSLQVSIKALHPSNVECDALLSKKNADLKKIVDRLELSCDKSKNATMRAAIWKHYEDSLNLQEKVLDVASRDGDIKAIWSKLQGYLPYYSLFQSDRKNSDSDSEVQDPLKEAVKQILGEPGLQAQLASVAQRVEEELQRVANLTLEKIREMNPEIANSLHPKIPASDDLKWTDVFFKKLSISGDEDIPINKRGSGVRRLILLNFFRAEVERRKSGRDTPSVIYAIEEPETSQHVDHQVKLISALEQIHNPRKDALVLGQRHFDRDQSYPHGGPGLLFSRAFVNEFIRRNVSFQRILAGNARKTYDVATGMLVLNEFSDAVWIDHPWLCIGAPETESLEVLGKRTWRELEKCPTDPGEGRAFVRLQDVVQFHIIPFKTETAGYVKNAEFAPEQVKLYRPTAYGVRFCWMDVDDNVAEIDSEWIPKFVVDKEAVKRRDAANV